MLEMLGLSVGEFLCVVSAMGLVGMFIGVVTGRTAE